MSWMLEDNKDIQLIRSFTNPILALHFLKENKIDLIFSDIEIGDGESYDKKPNVLEELAYRDTWGMGKDSFLSMIYERLVLMKDLLSDDGSIYVHMGIQVNNLIRDILDEIFGKNNFVSEIIWNYGSPSGGRASGTKIVKTHEYILHYSKNYKSRIENKIHFYIIML